MSSQPCKGFFVFFIGRKHIVHPACQGFRPTVVIDLDAPDVLIGEKANAARSPRRGFKSMTYPY